MKIITDVQQNTDEWRAYREGKITGTRLGKLFAKSRTKDELYNTGKRNIMFYQILAERLANGSQDAISATEAMERGHEKEPYAIAHASKELGIKREDIATDVIWQDDTDSFMDSPDAFHNSKEPEWVMECKCLSSANHLMAIVEDTPPAEYIAQIMNKFLVAKSVKTAYLVLFDDRFYNEKLWLKIFTFKRSDFEYQIERMRDIRAEAEKQLEEVEKELMK